MRKWLTIAGGGLMLAACGGGGGSGPVSVVSGTPAPSPTPSPSSSPTPSPSPSASPTPSPTSSYIRYADLTGDRTFQTACASLLLSGNPPTPQPALPFGDALTVGHAAAGGWTVSGDGVSLSFAASDAVAVGADQQGYERTVAGSVQRLTVAAPAPGGSTLNYVRSLALRTDRSQGATLYSCVFGVPTTLADVPTASASYARVAVNGTAYVTDQNGAVQTYVLTASTGTVDYDAAAKALVIKVRLLGNLQTASGTATATTDLGTFTGTGAVDAARGRLAGQLDSSDRVSLFSAFSGWFFGGNEAGSAFEVLAADPGTGNRMSAVGTVTAAR